MLSFRDFITGLRQLDIDRTRPVIVHAYLSPFGQVQGEAGSVLGALLSSYDTLIMPTFTYKTMIVPEMGPLDNAIVYGTGKDTNRLAEIYQPDMPADPSMGAIADALLDHPKVFRSGHPILSFSGINAEAILGTQTLREPLLPIQALKEQEGWVLLMGVGHMANTSIQYAEALAGRKQFVRWALTTSGVIACPGFPGCPDGFDAISPWLIDITREVKLGDGVVQAMPVSALVDIVCGLIRKDPTALLCTRSDCERCNTIRASFSAL